MASNYTVKQGDHLSSIAKDFGFSDYTTIWNHPSNAALKAQRQNPNVLFPGDQVYIPDLVPSAFDRPTDATHKFTVPSNQLKLILILKDQYEKPIANAKCVVTLNSGSFQLTTDGTGKLEQVISPDDHEGQLIIQDAQTPYQNEVFKFKIGNLDPIDQVSGQIARLNNLGYFAGTVGDGTSPKFESAVEEFQCDNGLSVDGICGPATRAKLKQVYGC
jgi:Putative peptidoglycan binding domain/LysM domain